MAGSGYGWVTVNTCYDELRGKRRRKTGRNRFTFLARQGKCPSQCPILVVPIEHVERRNPAVLLFLAALPHHHETIGVRQRQRPQQHGVHEREHGAVGADAERQRDRGHQRERGRRSQLPDRERHISSSVRLPRLSW